MIKPIAIGGRTISALDRPYLIAELSGNHNGSLDRAIKIVEAAAESGADAVKLQTYRADTMTLNLNKPDFVIKDEKSLWNGRQLFELYEEAHLPWEWHSPLMKRANELGIQCFSTPFDDTAVDFLESLDVPAYKIASFECTDLPLIQKVSRTGKPIIISCGMATLSEIDDAVRTARQHGSSQIVLLKCTSTYPASPENTNVSTIPHMRSTFDCEVGLSDHTMGCGTAIAAIALGARVIEKHFTLNRADGGVDSTFSMEPREFSMLRTEADRAWQAIGEVTYGNTAAEQKSLAFRRSLYIAKDMQAGETLTHENLRTIRPGYGLPPKFLESLLGKRIGRDAQAGTPVSWDLLSRQD